MIVFSDAMHYPITYEFTSESDLASTSTESFKTNTTGLGTKVSDGKDLILQGALSWTDAYKPTVLHSQEILFEELTKDKSESEGNAVR